MEQMANLACEIERALDWQKQAKPDYAQEFLFRALYLLDLTLKLQTRFSRFKELTRLREVLLDYFWGGNQFRTTEESLRKYFSSFIFRARQRF